MAYKNEVPLALELGDNRLTIRESEEFVISLFAGSEAEFGLYLYLPEDNSGLKRRENAPPASIEAVFITAVHVAIK